MKKIIFLACLLSPMTGAFAQTADQKIYVHDQLIMVSNQLNSSLPVNVGNGTRIDRTAVFHDTLQYSGTVVKPEDYDIKKIKKDLEQQVIQKMKTDPKYQPFRENRVTIWYVFRDLEGRQLINLVITPENYL